MIEQYRGHLISVTQSDRWHAIVTELETGITFPTKATAFGHEGAAVAASRARALVDLYLDQQRRAA